MPMHRTSWNSCDHRRYVVGFYRALVVATSRTSRRSGVSVVAEVSNGRRESRTERLNGCWSWNSFGSFGSKIMAAEYEDGVVAPTPDFHATTGQGGRHDRCAR